LFIPRIVASASFSHSELNVFFRLAIAPKIFFISVSLAFNVFSNSPIFLFDEECATSFFPTIPLHLYLHVARIGLCLF
jgi:hypothetical protein